MALERTKKLLEARSEERKQKRLECRNDALQLADHLKTGLVHLDDADVQADILDLDARFTEIGLPLLEPKLNKNGQRLDKLPNEFQLTRKFNYQFIDRLRREAGKIAEDGGWLDSYNNGGYNGPNRK